MDTSIISLTSTSIPLSPGNSSITSFNNVIYHTVTNSDTSALISNSVALIPGSSFRTLSPTSIPLVASSVSNSSIGHHSISRIRDVSPRRPVRDLSPRQLTTPRVSQIADSGATAVEVSDENTPTKTKLSFEERRRRVLERFDFVILVYFSRLFIQIKQFLYCSQLYLLLFFIN